MTESVARKVLGLISSCDKHVRGQVQNQSGALLEMLLKHLVQTVILNDLADDHVGAGHQRAAPKSRVARRRHGDIGEVFKKLLVRVHGIVICELADEDALGSSELLFRVISALQNIVDICAALCCLATDFSWDLRNAYGCIEEHGIVKIRG